RSTASGAKSWRATIGSTCGARRARCASTRRPGAFSASCASGCRGDRAGSTAADPVDSPIHRCNFWRANGDNAHVLTLLRIFGFTLIDELELPFGPGLTAITGETGAGKSILVDALGLLRGGRAGADVIRTGRDEARVEAILELPAGSAVRARLMADGREVEEGLLVRRVVARTGRGRAHLGGALATAADLSAMVAGLIDIASQHDQQSLTDPESQLAILDAFAENQPLRAEMASAYAARVAARAALESFSADARARGEGEALAAERERLRGAERFFGASARGEEALYAGDGAVSVRIAAVARELAPLAALDRTLAPIVETL